MPLEMQVPYPKAWNIGTIEEAEAAEREERARPRRTWMEVHAVEHPEVRLLTGRKGATALIWSTVPDGEKRLIGFLGRQEVGEIMRVFDL